VTGQTLGSILLTELQSYLVLGILCLGLLDIVLAYLWQLLTYDIVTIYHGNLHSVKLQLI
jgi:hypothetical protein